MKIAEFLEGKNKTKTKKQKKNSKVLTLKKKFSNFARLHVTLFWEPKISVSQKKKKMGDLTCLG